MLALTGNRRLVVRIKANAKNDLVEYEAHSFVALQQFFPLRIQHHIPVHRLACRVGGVLVQGLRGGGLGFWERSKRLPGEFWEGLQRLHGGFKGGVWRVSGGCVEGFRRVYGGYEQGM